MKRRIQGIISLAALTGLIAVTGCQYRCPSVRKQYLGGPISPPQLIRCRFKSCATEPTRPHVQLGQVQAEPSSDSVPTQAD